MMMGMTGASTGLGSNMCPIMSSGGSGGSTQSEEQEPMNF